ncbi:CHASE3 domain-containing protein [Mesorhizobium sp. IMUNJ 23232]|uniref:CHASE3 domain-containing protein n=1 Tax=Mesorhizobium sp. IMUNJ 23232 TaxID=3376064 RepID=UPI00378AF8AB
MIARLRRALRAQLIPLIAGFAVLAAIVAARSLLIESQRQDNVAVRQAFEFERRIVGVLGLAQDAETGQRGYLLTGEKSYLAPYTGAVQGLPKELETVREAAQANPVRVAQIDSLTAAIREKLAEIEETIRLYDAGNAAAALDLVRSDRGKVLMDTIRRTVADIRRDENALLQQRLANAEDMDDWMRLVSILALVAVFAMAAFGIWSARRRLEDLVSAHTLLSETNTSLQKEISTRQSAEAQIRQMQKMEAIGQLTGGIAHDFNNMLAVIMSAMNLVQRKLKRGETDIEKFVEAATDAASRAANLTARLLAFSRQQPLAPQVIDANRLVTGMSDLLRRTLGEPIQIETVLAGGLWRTFADTSQLENAILNLAVNARDAMPDGGRLTIETANCHLDERYSEQHAEVPAGQYVLVAVTDTGTGMPPEVAERAFDPFFTTKEVSKGTGLGLSQVFGFVKQSGGHVKIYSEPGEGTTIKVYLPRYFGEERVQEQAKGSAVVKTPTELVLVVEDDERVRAGTVAALRDLGYTVIHAGGAGEALSMLANNPGTALLFTDVIMPGTNGRKLAELARQSRPDLKVLFTTGFTKNAVVHNGVLDHGVDFIAKPFSIDQLALKIREVLDR